MEEKEILDLLEEFYQYTGSIPTVQDCDGIILPKYHKIKAFGGLRLLLHKLKIKKPSIREELLATLVRYYNDFGTLPKARDCQKTRYMRSHTAYVEEFNSWREALDEANRKIK